MYKRIFSLLLCILLPVSLPITALAVGTEAESAPETTAALAETTVPSTESTTVPTTMQESQSLPQDTDPPSESSVPSESDPPTNSPVPSESSEPTDPPFPSESDPPTDPPAPSESDPSTEPTASSESDPPTESTLPSEPSIPSEPSTPTEPPVQQIPTALEIDTEHIYQGMDMAYEDGYSPRVENGIAYIVLPLLSNGAINNEKIKVSLNLGGSSASPFVITNYEKTFPLETVTPKNSIDEVELFLVRFDVVLAPERTNGVYPVTVNISGYDATGKPIDCIYTIYVTITDGKSGKITPISPEVATAEPVVYISNTVIEPDKVTAGEEFTMTITLKNSLTTKSVKNMLVTVDTGNLQINLLEDSNVAQVNKIPAGGETELTFRFNSDASIPAGKYSLSFSFHYDSSKTLNLSSSGSTIVDIQQPANMELVMPRFAESVTVGETIPLSLQVINMGRDKMYNVRCVVSGFGFAPSNTGYIGTMDAGSSSTTKVELYIIALNASKGNENGEQYGLTTGTVSLIYEDDSGEEFQQDVQFETTVKRPIVELPQKEDAEEAEDQAKWAYWFMILFLGGAAIAAFVLGTVIRRQPKKHGRYL